MVLGTELFLVNKVITICFLIVIITDIQTTKAVEDVTRMKIIATTIIIVVMMKIIGVVVIVRNMTRWKTKTVEDAEAIVLKMITKIVTIITDITKKVIWVSQDKYSSQVNSLYSEGIFYAKKTT